MSLMSWSKHLSIPKGTSIEDAGKLIREKEISGEVHEAVEKACETGTRIALEFIEDGCVPSLEESALNVSISGHHNKDGSAKGNGLTVGVNAPY